MAVRSGSCGSVVGAMGDPAPPAPASVEVVATGDAALAIARTACALIRGGQWQMLTTKRSIKD